MEVDLFYNSDRDCIDFDSSDYEEIDNISEHSAVISDDPSDWPLKLTDSIRILFIKKRTSANNFPKNQSNRKFSSAYYQRILHNGE